MLTSELFTVVRNLIIDGVQGNGIADSSVIQGYQFPEDTAFISFIRLMAKRTSMLGQNEYTTTGAVELIEQTYTTLYEHHFQVSCFADDPYIANDCANDLYNYLTQFAQERLNRDYYGTGIGVVEDIVNMTNVGDKATYLPNFVVRFTLLAHQNTTREIDAIEPIEVAEYFI